MKIRYMCDSCFRSHELKSFIFSCIFCDNEICDECMWGFATCKNCKVSKTPKELEDKYREIYES